MPTSMQRRRHVDQLAYFDGPDSVLQRIERGWDRLVELAGGEGIPLVHQAEDLKVLSQGASRQLLTSRRTCGSASRIHSE